MCCFKGRSEAGGHTFCPLKVIQSLQSCSVQQMIVYTKYHQLHIHFFFFFYRVIILKIKAKTLCQTIYLAVLEPRALDI